jgi:flagella basal body P-ring formation protein FlgA
MTSIFPILALAALGLTPAAGAPSLEAALRSALSEAVRERATLPDEAEVEIGELRVADRSLLASASRLSAVELPPSERGLHRVSARARFQLRGGGEAWTWVSAPVDARVPALVAARALERGRPLVADDLRLAMHTVRPGQLTEAGEALGKAPRRDFREGELLGVTWLTAPHVMERGDTVEVVVSEGALSIRARGEALERGAVGDDVRVRIHANGRVVRGRVVDSGTVEVLP